MQESGIIAYTNEVVLVDYDVMAFPLNSEVFVEQNDATGYRYTPTFACDASKVTLVYGQMNETPGARMR